MILGTPSKSLLKRLLGAPIASSLRRKYRGAASCLMYHRIIEEPIEASGFEPNRGLCVTRDDFRAQMKFLRESAFELIDPAKLVEYLQAPDEGNHAVLVSFDDGYLDNYENALPVLKEFEIPATIFLSPGLVEGTAPLWWEELEFHIRHLDILKPISPFFDREMECRSPRQKSSVYGLLSRLCKSLALEELLSLLSSLRLQSPKVFDYSGEIMSWERIKTLNSHPLITLGAHTVNHPVLAALSEDQARAEIQESKQILEQQLDSKVQFFAYPYGDRGQAGEREFGLSEELGFELSFTTRFAHIHRQHLSHLQALPRLTVDYWDTPESLAEKLSGVLAVFRGGLGGLVVE